MARKTSDEHEEPARPDLWTLPLLEFIEAASAGHVTAPRHLLPLVEQIEAAERLEDVRVVAAAPVQHGKTTLLLYAIAWILLRHPDRHVIYVSFGARFAERQSRAVRKIYTAAGGRLSSDFNTIQEWQTDKGGGLLATSVDGELTGHPATHIFFDDPYKNREDAESAEHRERVEEVFSGAVNTRMAPGGSILVVASRWHEDDLSGRLLRGEIGGGDYVSVHLRAIETLDDGTEVALCPWGPDPRYPRTIEFLRKQRARVTEYDWSSLFQGEPRPKGGGLFRGVSLYTRKDLPKIVRVVVGADFAYSATGDRIAIVVLGLGEDGILYVLAAHAWEKSVLENLPIVRAVISEYAGAQIASYVSGIERGVVKHLARLEPEAGGPLRVVPLPAKLSKYVRSGRTARRWNGVVDEETGEVKSPPSIRVLRGAPWADELIREVCGFTGLDGGRDDLVDALVSGHDLMMGAERFESSKTGGSRFTFGARRC
jgi:hypothetical protein